MTDHPAAALEARALAKTWFYPFKLPSGKSTPTYDGGALDLIHSTRTQMLDAVLTQTFGADCSALNAVDLACHQGWFSAQLAQHGMAQVTGIDARPEHIEDANLIRDCLRLSNWTLRQSDVHDPALLDLGQHDVVLCLGLIYHLENPVGALRVARALCKRLCVVETQVVPGMTGWVDYGSYRFVRPLKGRFGIIDETGETHGPEASTTGICLVPSVEALIWIMHRIGFSRVEVLPVPADGYEQLVHNKRVMVAGWID